MCTFQFLSINREETAAPSIRSGREFACANKPSVAHFRDCGIVTHQSQDLLCKGNGITGFARNSHSRSN
jgi:hypothetical protein